MALQHSLDKYCRILESFTVLCEQARHALELIFRYLNYENFAGLDIPPAALSVQIADDLV